MPRHLSPGKPGAEKSPTSPPEKLKEMGGHGFVCNEKDHLHSGKVWQKSAGGDLLFRALEGGIESKYTTKRRGGGKQDWDSQKKINL